VTRLAAGRETHLTPDEIAEEALRQFDRGTAAPSIRSLAKALRVTPAAIYHHFPSQAAVFEATVQLVWAEATAELLELEPMPLEAPPVDVLVASGIATRRAWLRHFRVAPYLAATPEANEFVSNALGLMVNVFQRLGLEGEEAGAAFHGTSSFVIGSTLFAATRLAANDQLSRRVPVGGEGERLDGEAGPAPADSSGDETRRALDTMMHVSVTDPARDEELFAQGLRRLIDSFL
jgi:AcrR family transcriptional regulator